MTHKIKAKIGDDIFEGEGAEESVRADYRDWLTRVDREKTNPIPKAVSQPPGDIEIDDARLARIFELRQDDLVVFRIQPPKTLESADILTLLIFGYRKLKNQENILATQLLKAARQSGFTVDRIDRIAEPYIGQYILRGGQRKGATYTLTTQGILKAQEIAAQIPV